ncbi:hypothetical protein M405DRAFT_805443 [Rhizopogon salebrosus TDB-379]|nr:hypothetical protein M405DRAFT_805443 [Rhizopogon salebrosus TDB-379]
MACFLCHLLSYHSNDGFIPTFKGLSNLLFFGWLEKLIYRWWLTKNAITSLQILDRCGNLIFEGRELS